MENQGSSRLRSKPIKVIFNPGAGAARPSTVGLVDVIRELLAWKFIPEVFLVEPGCNLPGAVRDALRQGHKLFFVCGGDGTISSTAKLLAGSDAALGILPIGTQNNTALALGIPGDAPTAVSYLRMGKRVKVDVGMVTCRRVTSPFLEVCSVGLVSDLFPAADDIQHGNPVRVVDFLTTLAASPPAEIRLTLENRRQVRSQGHVVLVSNMPVIGLHYQIGEPNAYHDGLLDVTFFAELSKLDLLGYVFQGVGINGPEDPRIQRYRVRRVEIHTNPSMPVMIDGTPLGEGTLRIESWRHALNFIVGPALPEETIPPGKE